ncbi:MAG: ribonuclease HII [Candidatus Omnitrophica bacterium]|nr:ribonuclease HII [Candidatus Omnitrophota bacterium]
MIEFELSIKDEGFDHIIGIDEAGRGPLAGPVVASAVLVKDYQFTSKIADSKKISARQRESAFLEIMDKAHVGVGIISESVIDRINILEATYLAMNNAALNVLERMNADRGSSNSCLLVDGNRFRTDLPTAYKTVVAGDSKSFSIACASIVAKVTRDRILLAYDSIYPEYGFKQHKGYGTLKHRQALIKHGPSLIHRKTFIHL